MIFSLHVTSIQDRAVAFSDKDSRHALEYQANDIFLPCFISSSKYEFLPKSLLMVTSSSTAFSLHCRFIYIRQPIGNSVLK